jgi:hypothetical protein
MDTLKQYKIEVTYKDGRFNLYVPDLCLVASDGDLGKAYEIAAQHVDVLKARYIEAGIEDKFPKPDVVRKLPIHTPAGNTPDILEPYRERHPSTRDTDRRSTARKPRPAA